MPFQGDQAVIQKYLDRIGYTGPADVSRDCLFRLQECHLHTVPYENLDIRRGVPLSLDIDALYDKIVVRRRGGYCFELNALFGWLLGEIGFSVANYFARFWRDEANTPPKRRHQVLAVRLDDTRYLCDVGVGGIVPRRPVALVERLEQPQEDECYRLERDPEFGWMLCERKRDRWERIYSFTEEPQFAKDYVMASFWCEHAPDSVFRQTNIVAIRTKEGRNTVAGDEFRIFTKDGVRTFKPENEAQFAEALKNYFGIVL